jgi:hypothetical protein
LAFTFFKTIFLPPNVKNCLAVMDLNDVFERNSSDRDSAVAESEIRKDDTISYVLGFTAINRIPLLRDRVDSDFSGIHKIGSNSCRNTPEHRQYSVETYAKTHGARDQDPADTIEEIDRFLPLEQHSFGVKAASPLLENSRSLRRSPRSCSREILNTPPAERHAKTGGDIGWYK